MVNIPEDIRLTQFISDDIVIEQTVCIRQPNLYKIILIGVNLGAQDLPEKWKSLVRLTTLTLSRNDIQPIQNGVWLIIMYVLMVV